MYPKAPGSERSERSGSREDEQQVSRETVIFFFPQLIISISILFFLYYAQWIIFFTFPDSAADQESLELKE